MKRTKTVAKKEKKVKLTQEQVLVRLAKPLKKLVAGTVMRYQNGPLASIFNESEIEALAQDTALEVTRRVMVWNKNSRAKDAVNPKGCEAYFSRAFINQCQKMYEKYAKTDIRAGIQTVSSDEALAVAASKNLIHPENDYIIQREFKDLFEELKNIDERVNKQVTEQARKENRSPNPEELQYSYIILSKTLEGYEANEIREMINLTEVDYARHRRAALELAKEKLNFTLEELMEHFDGPLDYRLLTREVKKRKRSPNRLINYKINHNFYIQSSMDHKKGTCTTSLFVRLDVMDGEDRMNEIKPQLIKVKESEDKIKKADEIRQEMWAETKKPELLQEVKRLGEELIKKISKKKVA